MDYFISHVPTVAAKQRSCDWTLKEVKTELVCQASLPGVAVGDGEVKGVGKGELVEEDPKSGERGAGNVVSGGRLLWAATRSGEKTAVPKRKMSRVLCRYCCIILPIMAPPEVSLQGWKPFYCKAKLTG